jgi:hypothetical protein
MKRIEGQGDGGGDRLPLLVMNYFKRIFNSDGPSVGRKSLILLDGPEIS